MNYGAEKRHGDSGHIHVYLAPKFCAARHISNSREVRDAGSADGWKSWRIRPRRMCSWAGIGL